MKFRTEIKVEPSPLNIGLKDNALLLGSCFAENIGDKLQEHWWHASDNPLGIAYNPVSLFKHLTWLLEEENPDPERWMEINGHFQHYDLHSSFGRKSLEDSMMHLEDKLTSARAALENQTVLIISFGTAMVFELSDEKFVVNNCHKLPSTLFSKRCLSNQEIFTQGKETFDLLFKKKPEIKVVLTVSPIRHLRLGMAENQRSKAELISTVHQWVEHYTNVCYFPSYEILMDDLRDYRFYERDLIHPTAQAIDYIWEKFLTSTLTNEDQSVLNRIVKINQRMNHRPMSHDDKIKQDWHTENKELIKAILDEHPYLNGTRASNYLQHQDI